MEKDLSKMDIKDLKALAYDESVKFAITRQYLQSLNMEIAKRENGGRLADLPVKKVN